MEQEKDKNERDEMVRRMLERDNKHTSQQSSKKEQDEKRQKQQHVEQRLLKGETVVDEVSGRALNLDRLREESRRAYLKKREERELELLKISLQDEEYLFKGEKLTEKERKKIEIGKQILSMASNRKEENEQPDGFYRLPDDIHDTDTKASRHHALLSSRYIEPKQEKSEGQLWEEAQVNKATSFIPKKRKIVSEKDYDLVFDDEIDFVMQETTSGYDRRASKYIVPEDDVDNKTSHKITKPQTAHEKILEGRKNLPVYPYRDEFLAALKEHQVLILVGETGSGKTTQIPQYLHEIGYSELGRIGCTQPRRVAAMSVAARVAQEMNVRLGHEVGYSIRFENCTNTKTVIQYMTDGMLLREILTQPDLASYSCMVIDEAHERTLHTDILFGLVKDIVRFRPDLKLIISSATLDAEKFSKYFDDASIFMIPGRMFPVDIYYTKAPEADYVDASVVTVLQIHVSQPLNGDVLVFLTGQEEIETAAETLAHRAKSLGSRIPELMICPIYANLPADQQAKIFEKTPKGARKVVLATNIAETSLTIDGICFVIDTGFNKQKTYNARSGMESLVVTPISQAAANQRAGRAGRTQPGKCFRLYTAFSFQHELEPNTVPEILRTNLGNVVLMLKSLGINDLISFDFMDKPPADALIRALEQLYALSALSDSGELTKMGRRMAEFPLDPMLSKTVIVSEKYKCTSEILSTVSMLSLGASVFYRPKEKAVHADTARLNFARGGGGDHIALLRCYSDWAATEYSQTWCFENYVQVRSMKKARDIREQLESLCERVEVDITVSSPDDIDATLKAMTAGFFYNIAKLGRSGEYQTIKQPKTVYIHPSSVLAKEEEPPPWVVYFELAFTTKEYMRQVAPIQPGWLIEIAPHYYQESEVEDAKSKKMPKSRTNRR
jgi:pre-mRNA-splicing factor ATP-dependent RNA helicase DHX16